MKTFGVLRVFEASVSDSHKVMGSVCTRICFYHVFVFALMSALHISRIIKLFYGTQNH